MENESKKLNCKGARQVDLVEYLASLGYHPTSKKGRNLEYLSMLPGRFEKTPSFKVDPKKNVWYDWGITKGTKGGDIIDFGELYFSCDTEKFLEILSITFLLGQPVPQIIRPVQLERENPVEIIGDTPIRLPSLIYYLRQRRIPLNVAHSLCRQAEFKFKEKNRTYYAIGMQNDLGGWELRNDWFKGSSTPKGVTFIDNGCRDVSTCEGMFDFLTYLTIVQQQTYLTNYLILNGTGLAEQAFAILDRHELKHLYWDRGKGGEGLTAQAKARGPGYLDHSDLFNGFKDLNHWHCHIGSPPEARLPSPAKRKLHL